MGQVYIIGGRKSMESYKPAARAEIIRLESIRSALDGARVGVLDVLADGRLRPSVLKRLKNEYEAVLSGIERLKKTSLFFYFYLNLSNQVKTEINAINDLINVLMHNHGSSTINACIKRYIDCIE